MPLDAGAADSLPSWNAGSAKPSIVDFVTSVTDEPSDDFVAPRDRIAVFDNDGTLWPEAPIPFQAAWVFDEVKRRASQEPQLAADPMVQAGLEGYVGKLLEGNHHDGLLQVMGITHAGMTTDEFDQWVGDRQTSSLQTSVLGVDLPTDAAAACLSAGKRLQVLHRFWRWGGFHAILVGACVWDATGKRRRIERASEIRDQIKLGPLAMTRRAGPPALMDQEKKFTSALPKATRFRIAESGLLHLSDDVGNDVLRFSRIQD